MIDEMVNSLPKIMQCRERRNLERFKKKSRIKGFYDEWLEAKEVMQ